MSEHTITPDMAYEARGPLSLARDAALLANYMEGERLKFQLERVVSYLQEAAAELGYTLTPIVTPSPDSGRAKEIGDVFQNHGA